MGSNGGLVSWAREGLLEKNDVRIRCDRTAEIRQVIGAGAGVGSTAILR